MRELDMTVGKLIRKCDHDTEVKTAQWKRRLCTGDTLEMIAGIAGDRFCENRDCKESQ